MAASATSGQLSADISANKFPGDDSERVTPVPIPNTVVKPLSADGTAGIFRGRVGRRQVYIQKP